MEFGVCGRFGKWGDHVCAAIGFGKESNANKQILNCVSHILTKKTTKQKRRLTNTGLVDKSDLKNVKQQLSMK